jgi:hypothetical protein
MNPRPAPLYVSFYTIGNGYEAEAEELVRTLDAHRLPHCVRGVTLEGSTWRSATQYKAEFVREMQKAHPDRPIVWLDADARVKSRPRLFDCLDCHFAAHWYRHKELLSSTLYFAPGEAARKLVEKWVAKNLERPNMRCADQRNLQHVAERQKGLRVVNLPAEYAWIDGGRAVDMSARTYGRRHPVIVQEQASRRLNPYWHRSVPEAVEEPVV